MRPMVGCAALLAALSSAACKTMKTVPLDQLNVVGPDRAWVTESDQSVVLMYEPKVVGDSLVGYIGRYRANLPSAGVKQLRVQTSAPKRTVLLVVGIAAGLGGFLVMVEGGGQSQVLTTISGQPGDCDKHPEQPACTGSESQSVGSR